MALWNRTEAQSDLPSEDDRPEHVALDSAPALSAPALPMRTPGTAPAIADSRITASALQIHPTPVSDPVASGRTVPVPTDDHPLTANDLSYRYSKEIAGGINAGLRQVRAGRSLDEMSDRDLGLVTVTTDSIYDAVCADLGTPSR